MEIVPSKIQIPNTSKHFLMRTRVEHILSNAVRSQTAYLSAPAGYGKTTLLANWAKKSDNAVAWITMDEQSNNVRDFIKHICLSIANVLPSTNDIMKEVIKNDVGLDALLAGVQAIKQPFTIILDDFHAVDNRTIISGIVSFIKYKPKKITLIIAARSDIHDMLALLVLDHKIKCIDQGQLAFSQDEIVQYLDQKGLVYKSQDAKQLLKATEGWPLAVAGLSMGKSITFNQNSNRESLINQFLEQEVWLPLSTKEKAFLIATSTLTQFTLKQVMKLTDCKDGKTMLEDLTKKCVFINVNDNNEYRYHQYFKAFVLKHASKSEKQVAHLRAAVYFEQAEQWGKAIAHYQKTNKAHTIIELIDRYPDKILLALSPERTIRLIDSLPKKEVKKRINISICYGWALQYLRKPYVAEAYIKTIAQCLDEQRNNLNREQIRQVKLETAAMALPFAIANKDKKTTIACLKTMYLTKAKAAIVFNPEILQSLYDSEYTLRDSAFGLYGRHDFFISLLNKAESGALKPLWLIIKSMLSLQVAYAETLYEQNANQQAISNLAGGIAKALKTGNANVYLSAMLCLANLQKAAGDMKQCYITLKTCHQKLEDISAYLAIKTLEAYKARLDLQLGNMRLVKVWQQGLLLNAYDDVSDISRVALYQYLSLAYVLIKNSKLIIARLLVDRLQMLLDTLPDIVYKSQAIFLDALLALEEQNETGAISKTARFVEMGIEDGYNRTFTDFGNDCVRLLALLLEKNADCLTESKAKYVETLMKVAHKQEQLIIAAKKITRLSRIWISPDVKKKY